MTFRHEGIETSLARVRNNVGTTTKAKGTECNLCGSDRQKPFSETRDYISGETFRVVRCEECGLVYVDPQPPLENLHRYYPVIHQMAPPAAYERLDARGRVRAVKRIAGHSPSRILDIGCGKGLLLKALSDCGWSVAGTEMSESSCAYANSIGVPVFAGAIGDAPFEHESFDVITLFHVLEHLPRPREALSIILELLRPGGILIVEVPNIGSWYARLFGNDWFHYDVPRHLYHFDTRTLTRILRTSGFSIIETSTRNLQYDAFGAVQSTLNRILDKPNLLNDFNTGQVKLRDLWKNEDRLSNLGALTLSQLTLSLGFPLFAAAGFISSPLIQGGTLRFVATKETALDQPR